MRHPQPPARLSASALAATLPRRPPVQSPLQPLPGDSPHQISPRKQAAVTSSSGSPSRFPEHAGRGNAFSDPLEHACFCRLFWGHYLGRLSLANFLIWKPDRTIKGARSPISGGQRLRRTTRKQLGWELSPVLRLAFEGASRGP